MKNLLILFLLIICVGFAQDKAQDKDRNQVKTGSKAWISPQGKYSVNPYNNRPHLEKKVVWKLETCAQMLENIVLEQDSILHNCPEHKLVMLYKCPQCQATSLKRVHACIDKETTKFH